MTSLPFFVRSAPANVRLTSEPEIGAEFAKTSVASRKLRDNRRVWLKRLLEESIPIFLLFLSQIKFTYI